jgi:hypothetical protein
MAHGLSVVIAELDPAIHVASARGALRSSCSRRFIMEARDKPGHDTENVALAAINAAMG